MVIVLIHWKIIPNRVDDFLKFWKTTVVVENRHGLIGEFLSEPHSPAEYPWITWDIMGCEGKYRSFINVGYWVDAEEFHEQVGKYIPKTPSEKKDFEYEPRLRTVLKPKCWRMGDAPVPAHDSEDTL